MTLEQYWELCEVASHATWSASQAVMSVPVAGIPDQSVKASDELLHRLVDHPSYPCIRHSAFDEIDKSFLNDQRLTALLFTPLGPVFIPQGLDL